ncbi:MAG TPA: hypothetical protein VMF30_10550 [Pirellulales bacterium]|nr:hypothetical protein [Pirellulales bacterium]
MYRTLLAAGLVWWATLVQWPARGEEAEEAAPPIEIELSGRPIETPLLKYRLFPEESQLRPGNAAVILLRIGWDNTAFFMHVVPMFKKWETLPLGDPEWGNSGGVLPNSFFAEMKRAAYRRDAAWEYPIGESLPRGEILLPDIQGARDFVRAGLVGKARYHLTQGQLEQARETVLVALAIFRHYARTPSAVVQGNASANTRAILGCVDEMIGQRDSPNLYWALTALPRPMFDLRPSIELEQTIEIGAETISLADLDRERTPERWRELANKLIDSINDFGVHQLQEAKSIDRAVYLAYAREMAADWAGQLPENGSQASDDEAIVRCFVSQRTRNLQQIAGLVGLPPHLAIDGLRKLDEQSQKRYERLKVSKQAGAMLLMNGLASSVYSVGSVERKIDMLRVIEAIRAHVAAHDGKLPESLADIADLPIPLDPLSQQPFKWKAGHKVGRLSAPHVAGGRDPNWANFTYMVRVP